MGLNFSADETNSNNQPAAFAAQPEQPQHKEQRVSNHQFQGGPTPYTPFDNLTGNGVFGQAIVAADGDATFTKILDTMKKTLEASPGAKGIKVFGFDKESHQDLHFSVIAVVRDNSVPMAPGLSKHTFITTQLMLVEATGDALRAPPPDTSSLRRGRSYTVTPTPEDVYNSYLVDFVQKQLFAVIPDVRTMYTLDPVIIRRTADTSEQSIKRMLQDAQIAVEVRSHQRVPGFKDMDYTSIGGNRDVTVPVTATIGAETKFDSQGLPTYQDASISVDIERGSERGQRHYVPNGPNSSRRICQTSVMVDLVNVNPDYLQGQVRGKAARDFDPQVAWAPRLIVTGIEQFQTRTTAGVFFALASTAELGARRKWAETFRPSVGNKDKLGLRDIGYLNIEANLDNSDTRHGQVIDTSPAVFSDLDMEDMLDATVTHGALMAVDCPTSGPNAYTTTLLVNVARGDEVTRRESRKELIRALRDATGGRIDTFINLDQRDIVIGSGDRFHMGYWTDMAGNLRDIRELDNYLAIAARLGKNDPELIRNWTDSWLASDVASEDQRMAERLELIKAAAEGSVTVTGTGVRISLESEVIEAFALALADGDVPLVSRGTGDGEHFRSKRAVADVSRASLYTGSSFGIRDSGYRRDRDERGNRFAPSRY